MFRMGSGELLVVLFVAMIFLGPKQIKQLVSKWTELVKSLRTVASQLNEEIEK